jgi:hypothetical protein
MFYYYSACLHFGKTKENFSTVGVIYRVIQFGIRGPTTFFVLRKKYSKPYIFVNRL